MISKSERREMIYIFIKNSEIFEVQGYFLIFPKNFLILYLFVFNDELKTWTQ